MKTEKKIQIITEKSRKKTEQKSPVIATYFVRDESVQAELRLSSAWAIRIPVDKICYPKDLSGSNGELWNEMWPIARDITIASDLKSGSDRVVIPINEKTKSGPVRRAEAKADWMISSGMKFLADYKAATGKKHLAEIGKTIALLQAAQKSLIPKLRESNAAYLAGKVPAEILK